MSSNQHASIRLTCVSLLSLLFLCSCLDESPRSWKFDVESDTASADAGRDVPDSNADALEREAGIDTAGPDVVDTDGRDGSCSVDTDGDGLTDCREREIGGCLDPTDRDSDGDGRWDGDEIADGMDPCVPDNSGTEGEWWRGFCDDLGDSSNRVRVHNNADADLKMVLEPSTASRDVTVDPQSSVGGVTFLEHPTLSVSGFAMTMEVSSEADWKERVKRAHADLLPMGTSTSPIERNLSLPGSRTGAIHASNGYSDNCKSAAQIRNNLVESLGGLGEGAISSTGGTGYGGSDCPVQWITTTTVEPSADPAVNTMEVRITGGAAFSKAFGDRDAGNTREIAERKDRVLTRWTSPGLAGRDSADLKLDCRMVEARQAPDLDVHFVASNRLEPELRTETRDIVEKIVGGANEMWFDTRWYVHSMDTGYEVSPTDTAPLHTPSDVGGRLDTIMRQEPIEQAEPFERSHQIRQASDPKRLGEHRWFYLSKPLPDREISDNAESFLSHLQRYSNVAATALKMGSTQCQEGDPSPEMGLYASKIGGKTGGAMGCSTLRDVIDNIPPYHGAIDTPQQRISLTEPATSVGLRIHTRRHRTQRMSDYDGRDGTVSFDTHLSDVVLRGDACADVPIDDGIEKVAVSFYRWERSR